MNNPKYIHTISSTLKTVASENLVTEDELLNSEDKPLETIFNTANEIQKTPQKSETKPKNKISS
jgi:hypothetical protein